MAANKRTADQILRDRVRITELALQQHTTEEIRAILHEETGIELSRRQISYDRAKIKDAWRKKALENYSELMNTELSRIDILERSIWQALRAQVQPKRREEIDRARRKVADADDDEYEMVITKTKEVVEDTAANASYFAQIADCQKERRKLYGLYAPQEIGVQKTVIVKGYAEVSPADWPSVIEGEIIKVEE
jgi:hypothetical protein